MGFSQLRQGRNFMGALTIAFDITIIGALALSWVILVVHLFFSQGECHLGSFLDWLKELNQPAAVAVLLFAVTYTLGSAVSRIAQDFFNDDDLRVQIDGYFFRVGVTEDRIIAKVYCTLIEDDNTLLPPGAPDSPVAQKIHTFQAQQLPHACNRTLLWHERHKYTKADDDMIGTARDIFRLQENQLLLRGEDQTLRLRQLHDQIMVLRGASFSGFIACSLCLFALGGKIRCQHKAWWRYAFVPVPLLYLAVAFIATYNHFQERAPSDPPYMEFTLILLAVAGLWLVWKRPKTPEPEPEKADPAKKTRTIRPWQNERWGRLVALSALLTLAAILGWWSTELFYGQQVVYTYDAQYTAAATQK
jgi:hypothetical protein